jgi:mono/diheme cytochrome c family protein
MRTFRGFVLGVICLAVAIIIAAGIWVWSGSYDIGADTPHWGFTKWVIGKTRVQSIKSHSAGIKVPDLDQPGLLAEGAHHYAAMCTGCHLAPGMGESELREGLYPKPPNLTHFSPPPAVAFWVIKHGIKMTAMPAWGKTHDDQKIWAMVAYLEKQPHMSVEHYRKLAGITGSGASMAHGHMGHGHAHMPAPTAAATAGPPATSRPVPAPVTPMTARTPVTPMTPAASMTSRAPTRPATPATVTRPRTRPPAPIPTPPPAPATTRAPPAAGSAVMPARSRSVR